MNLFKNISTKKLSSPPGLVIISCVIVSFIAVFIGSQDLAAHVDLENIYLAPFENSSYIFGTDGLGRSVGYGLLNGIKVSLSIAFFTALLSLTVGLLFSYLAGYLGDSKLHASYLIMFIWLLASSLFIFYLWYSFSFVFLMAWVLLSYMLLYIDKTILKGIKKNPIPLDTIVMKMVAFLKSMPGIFLILFMLALTSKISVFSMIIVITISRAPRIVRLARSEVLKVKNQEYILAAEGMGLKTFETFFKHIVPNIMTPLTTYLIYTMAGTILIESALSFLGLGLPLETVSLGSMLSSSRDYFGAWWLAIFPGGVIFFLIYSIRKLLSHNQDSAEYLYL